MHVSIDQQQQATGIFAKIPQEYLNEKDLSRVSGIPVRTLQDWRRRSVGPPYRKLLGRLVRYPLAEALAWLDTQPSGGGER